MPAVNSRRPYDSTSRRERAARARANVLEVARVRFLRDGYAATTVSAVAADGGVSPEFVYKAFGSKAGLARSLAENALLGEGPIPAERRSDELQAAVHDPRSIITAWAALTLEVAPRVAPILLLLKAAAASDDEVSRLAASLEEERLARMAHNAMAIRPHLRVGMTDAECRDILWTYSSPELYDLLVIHRQWPLERYGRFIEEGMATALLG